MIAAIVFIVIGASHSVSVSCYSGSLYVVSIDEVEHTYYNVSEAMSPVWGLLNDEQFNIRLEDDVVVSCITTYIGGSKYYTLSMDGKPEVGMKSFRGIKTLTEFYIYERATELF